MTIGSHVAEIARQGIWASLTGGWCYEPANSIFCNTVHLYTWSILLISPLLIGMFASGAISLQVFVGYVVFIVLFFALLKLVIIYLHNVFDTTDPIIKYTTNKKTATSDICRSPRSSFSGRAMSANDIEMIDMGDVRRTRRSVPEDDDNNRRPSRRVEEEPDFPLFHNLKSIHEDDSSSSGSSKRSHNGLLESKDEHPRIAESFILPADSFELLPMATHSMFRRPSENANTGRVTAISRKSSEPSLEVLMSKSVSSKTRGSSVSSSMRRVHSSSDAAHQHLFQRRSSAYYQRDSVRHPRRSSLTSIRVDKLDSDEHSRDNKIIDDGQEPCCSKSLQQTSRSARPSGDNPDEVKTTRFKTMPDSPSPTKGTGAPSAGMLRRFGQKDFPVEEVLNQPADLKGKITKFLEELIDKHPETLDVIESVRQNRLGNRATGFNFEVDRESSRPGPSHQVSRLTRHRAIGHTGFATANLKDGTHVAYDHADTTEGAVHSFQDEYGTWWTYTFSDQGTGVAHPLGSTRAINELFNQRMSESPKPSAIDRKTKHRRHASAAGAVASAETCSIGSSQSGPSRLAKSAGTSRRSESLTTDKIGNLYSSVLYVDSRPEEELELGKLSDPQESTGDNQAASVTQIASEEEAPSERRPKRRRRRRQRIHSSSSEEGGGQEYISNVPANILHSASGIAPPMPIARQLMSLAQRFTNTQHPPVIQNLSSSTGNSIFYPVSVTPSGSIATTSRGRTALERFADERRRRVLTVDGAPNERREYVRLQMESDGNLDLDPNHASSLSSVNTMRIINELVPLGATGLRFTPRQSKVKANYYYKLKPFTLGQGLQVKLDRLSVAALFDRNNTIISYLVDVFLAAIVTILAAALIGRGIYEDICLLIFAFVVAGSQFSLLKSVQPDAASPVHGFNWLVSYSRPAYFILLGSAVLLLDLWAADWNLSQNTSLFSSWNWNPFTDDRSSKIEIIVGIRDIVSTLLLLLPVAFTIGLLPQVSTLSMHVLEQLDMHIFGSTASFSLFSAFIGFLRSLFAVSLLTLIGHFAYFFDAHSTQNTVYSAFIAATISIAYIMSRWSSNPLFLTILFKQLMPWNAGCIDTLGSVSDDENEVEKTENKNTQTTKEAANNPPIASSRREENEIEIESPVSKPEIRTPGLSVMGNFKTSDPLPDILKNTLAQRVHSDLFYFVVNSLVIFGLHCTSVFTATQPYFEVVISCLCILFGFMNHYLYRKLRMHTPWKVFARPLLKPHEFFLFESTVEAKLMMFERVHIWMLILEKNVLYPLLLTSYMTTYGWELPIPANDLPDPALSWLIVPITALCAFRTMRTAYSQPQIFFIPLTGVFVLSTFGIGVFQNPDYRSPLPDGVVSSFWNSPKLYITPLIVLYIFIGLYPKVQELTLKLNFVLAYIAPWQISWGSAFHAFAQPFSLPHSGMIMIQAIFSSLISAPLNPFLGSSFFLMSYVRPVKFWEKDYNTKRVDHSNLRLISQIDRGPMMDDSNLNAIFYEHLTRSLQQSLAGDLQMGRWATSVHPGDCFILASNYLNCLVHIIEVGNGFVTFQVRGLEFRGTYCHQREVEAISEDLNDSNGFCCCTVGSPNGLLSMNNMFALRWLAWEVTASKYIIDGYSITDNSAVNLLQVHELRRLLMSLYVKCIIYYAVTSKNFEKWLQNETIVKSLEPILENPRYVDSDQIFCAANDEDYDLNVMGISRSNFEELYGSWIQHCYERRLAKAATEGHATTNMGYSLEVVTCFCFSLSILGRRTLGTAAYNRHANAAESFLFGLHALFKGDLRITSSLDEWVFCDPDILTTVISPAVRMSLKLHQDHFAAADDFEQISQLYDKIEHYQTMLFISHEHDPSWRQAIISNIPSLLALRHMYDDGQDDYKIIMLNKMHLNMRVIKLNRECVRAFWAGQQQELIFLRNRNPERGSIQNARQVLRNMINSSADQPIGYPIYVSPLTTSFIESHSQVNKVVGPSITFCTIGNAIRKGFRRLRQHFGTSGSSNLPIIIQSGQSGGGMVIGPSIAQAGNTPAPYRKRAAGGSAGNASAIGLPQGQEKLDDAISIKTAASSTGPSQPVMSLVDLSKPPPKPKRKFEMMEEEAGASTENKEEVCGSDSGNNQGAASTCAVVEEATAKLILGQTSINSSTTGEEIYVQIIDKTKIVPRLNEPLKSTNDTVVVWPCEDWKKKAGKPPNEIENGMRGTVAHMWKPFHAVKGFRSHAGFIYLVRMFPKHEPEAEPFYLPILQDGVFEISKEEFLRSPLYSPDRMAKFGVVRPISESSAVFEESSSVTSP